MFITLKPTIAYSQTHNQPDVYETPDTSTSSETKKYEDDSQSDSVSKLECGVGKSYDAFKGKAVHSENTGISMILLVFMTFMTCICRFF